MNLYPEEDTTITKFDINGKVIFIKICWKKTVNKLFEIKILDDNNSWTGYFDAEFAEQCRKNVDENEEDYFENVKTCLTSCSNMYVYEFTNISEDEKTAIFKWKKKFEGTTTVLVHGSVQLHRDTITEGKDTLFDILLNENKIQKLIIAKNKQINEELVLEVVKLKEELIKFMDIKDSQEDNLYGKFISLLNTKKRRIQLLEDHLQNCQTINRE